MANALIYSSTDWVVKRPGFHGSSDDQALHFTFYADVMKPSRMPFLNRDRITSEMTVPVILLASNSPRRRELLALTGWGFITHPVNIDETPLPGELPPDYVLRLAEGKARAAAALTGSGMLVFGSDTTVADGTDILGKPLDAKDAAAMLTRLRGHSHTVYTALALFRPETGELYSDLCATLVPMRNYSDDEMIRYVQSGDPLDKAGAYAIQHVGFHPVEHLAGCFASVMGLPLCHLVRLMCKAGISPAADVPAACQSTLQYACVIHEAVLAGEKVG